MNGESIGTKLFKSSKESAPGVPKNLHSLKKKYHLRNYMFSFF